MAYIYDLTDTWNAGGTTFSAIKMNVTDSASAAGSKLVTLQTNGTEHFSVTKAGVGYFSSDGLFGLSTASSSRRLRIYGCTATAAASSLQLMTSTSGTGVSDGFTLELDGNEAYVWNYETANIRFGTANAERMRITSAGDVGIGTTSPDARLDVWGSSGDQIRLRTAATEFYRMGRNNATGVMEFYGSQTGFTSYTFGGVDGERMRITSGGNLLLGTTASSGTPYILELNTASDTRIGIKAGNVLTGIIQATTNNFSIATSGASTVTTFSINGTERMRIDSSGNVGIGATSPANKLHVAGGAVRISDATNSTAVLIDASTTGGLTSITTQFGGSSLALGSAATERLRIKSSGGVRYIPLASAPSSPEAGEVYYDSTTNKLRCYNGTTWNDLF